jgi:hypothetical protein
MTVLKWIAIVALAAAFGLCVLVTIANTILVVLSLLA